jgi:hypothetical protein
MLILKVTNKIGLKNEPASDEKIPALNCPKIIDLKTKIKEIKLNPDLEN